MTNNIPYLRKNTLTLVALSAIALLLLASPLVLFDFLLQPAQAQTLMTFQTLGPARGRDPASGDDLALTFNVYGTTSSPNPQSVKITGGTVQLQDDPENDGTIYNGTAFDGAYTNDSKEGPNFYFSTTLDDTGYDISSACSTSGENTISLSLSDDVTVGFGGEVECSTGGGNTASSSSSSSSTPMTGTSAQDRDSSRDGDADGDGIPDSNDRCTHNSNHRCFKEGDASTTTTQQQPSSSNSTRNQTR